MPRIKINQEKILKNIEKLEWFAAPWTANLWKKTIKHGGFINFHCHIDRADTCQPEFMPQGIKSYDIVNMPMKEKPNALIYIRKRAFTVKSLTERMEDQIQRSIQEGVKELWAQIDTTPDPTAFEIGLKLKNKYKNKIKIRLGAYSILGFNSSGQFEAMEKAAEAGADFFLGLPERDEDQKISFEDHINILLEFGYKYKKPVAIHLDQANTAYSHDSFRAIKCLEKLEKEKKEWFVKNGMLNFVHTISLSCYTEIDQDKIISLFKKYNIRIIVCPRAALSMMHFRSEKTPLHVSVAPVLKMLQKGVRIGIGTDNTHDHFIPSGKGLIIDELSVLSEMLRFYNLESFSLLGRGEPMNSEALEEVEKTLAEIKKASNRHAEYMKNYKPRT